MPERFRGSSAAELSNRHTVLWDNGANTALIGRHTSGVQRVDLDGDRIECEIYVLGTVTIVFITRLQNLRRTHCAACLWSCAGLVLPSTHNIYSRCIPALLSGSKLLQLAFNFTALLRHLGLLHFKLF